MKKLITIFIFSIFFFPAIAQSNIRLNNYWGNAHYINPASIYDKYLAEFSMAVRKQWVGFPGAPTTFFASGTTYMEDYHTQLGLKLTQDNIGYSSISNINLSYAYAIMFQRDWQLHLGLGANYQFLSYDMSKLNLSDYSDQTAYYKLLPRNQFNADLGFEVTNKSLRMGAASQNIFSIFSPTNYQLQTNTNILYARYREQTNQIVNLSIGACAFQYANIYQLELNLTSYFKFNQFNGLTDKPDLFDFGVFYRTKSELGLIFGFNIGESMHLSYSYDFHLGSINRGSYGTNELIITYNLQRKPICHNCWY